MRSLAALTAGKTLPEKVLRERGGGDEELRGDGAHDGREHGGKDDAGEERGEKLVRHQQEDALGVCSGEFL